MAITTAVQLARMGQPSTDANKEVDFSTVKLGYITIVNSQVKTQLMLVQQFPLF